MKNKIINLNIKDRLKELKQGGGSPKYLSPKDLRFIDQLISEFKLFSEKLKDEKENISFTLTHKDSFPAISNRFVESMKTIFGNTFFEYKSTTLVENKDLNEEILHFIYQANKKQLDNAIYRLSEIKIFLNEILDKMNLSIEEWFNIVNEKSDHPLKAYLEDSIKNHFKKMSISYISKTSLLKLLSSGYHKYKNLELLKGQTITLDDDSIKFVSFISKEFLDKSKKILNDSNIKWQQFDDSSLSIDLQNANNNISMDGILYVENNNLKEMNKNNSINLENINFTIYDYLQKDQTKSMINVGVIDGGVQNEIFKKYINYHGLDEFESFLPKPSGTHAEEVCSIILFGNKLSPTLNDNCYQPNVHLFDIVFDSIKPDKFLELIEKILKKYHKIIKIWNLSIIIENSIIEKNMWKNGISFFGNKLDKLQKKYDVLFIVPTGNKLNEKSKVINSPSDSMLAISVSCCNYNKTKTGYSLSGESNKNKFYAIKPDFAIRTENNDGDFVVLSNGVKIKQKGTSYAVPWVVRKVAHLFGSGIELFAIPAILNAFTIFNTRSEKIDDYFGLGILPIDIKEIINFNNSQAVVTTKLSVENYSQGFFELKLPKSEDNEFPFNFVMSVNVVPNFSEFHSFEYIEDTVRVQFGAVSPFDDDKFPKLEQNWKILSIYGDADDAFTKERSLRQYFGKYKNRYSNCLFIQRPKRSFITKKGEQKEIENWGFSIVRNDIKSKRKGKIDVYICLIMSNIKGNAIYENIFNLNKQYIDLQIVSSLKKGDDIQFE